MGGAQANVRTRLAHREARKNEEAIPTVVP
jgi:hypothetical protein